MKSFKIVFASLMIAALGIVGFSSFKSDAAKAPAKALVVKSFVFNDSPGDWEEADPTSLCDGDGVLCGISFNDAQISESAAKSFAESRTRQELLDHDASIPYSNGVTIYEKD